MFKRLFRKEGLEIIPVKTVNGKPREWDGNGIIFYVKNGKSLLCHKYGNYEDKALLALTYDNIPLIKFHADEYFCPTCEKLVSAGYGLDMANDDIIREMRELFNSPFISLENSFENLKPLFGLLHTGYYALIDVELYPSDGNGQFFWKINNTPVYNKASCPIYGGDGLWSEAMAKYVLPSQPPTRFNREAAEYYRKNDNYRAIAYYLEGYLCTLIDGHHKAVAAALEHRPLKTLVIIPTGSSWYKSKHLNEKLGGISFNGVSLYENEMITPLKKTIDLFKLNRMSDEEARMYLSMINTDFDKYEWEKDILQSEKYYPEAMTVARIYWAGGITDERLDKIVNHQVAMIDTEVLNLVTALSALEHPRFKELAFHFCSYGSLVSVWRDIFMLLAKIRDEEVENFFIQYLIDAEIERADLKKIIGDYLRGM
jgi:hypothetical protein